MFGVKRHILVTLLRDIPTTDLPSSSTFDPYLEIKKSLKKTIGNTQLKQNIIKEAYDPTEIEFVYDAYGKMGVKFSEFTAFKRNDLTNSIDRNTAVSLGDEIVLINNNILNKYNRPFIASIISKHRIIPTRKTPIS